MYMKKPNLGDGNFQEAEEIQLHAGLALSGLSLNVCFSGDGNQGLVRVRQALFNRAVSLTPFILL